MAWDKEDPRVARHLPPQVTDRSLRELEDHIFLDLEQAYSLLFRVLLIWLIRQSAGMTCRVAMSLRLYGEVLPTRVIRDILNCLNLMANSGAFKEIDDLMSQSGTEFQFWHNVVCSDGEVREVTVSLSSVRWDGNPEKKLSCPTIEELTATIPIRYRLNALRLENNQA